MLSKILTLLFPCSHKRMSFPLTIPRKGMRQANPTYVACLECGKTFNYDFDAMKVGKALATAHPTGSPTGELEEVCK